MDTEKAKALLAAVDLGSMTAAADKLGYTPSGILRMVNALEAELGATLVARSKRGVMPTSEGAQVIPLIRETVQAAERASQQVADMQGLLAGELSVATYQSIAATWLPQILKRFESSYPHVRIDAREGGNSQLVEWVEQRAVDCALIARRAFSGDWIPLREDRLMAWLPADHPRAKSKAFPVRELDGQDFIEISPHQDTDLRRLLAAEGLVPRVRYSTTSSNTAFRMVEAGLGMSINNELMTTGWTGSVAVIPFEPERTVELGIAIPSLGRASAATRAFIACAQEVCKQDARSRA